LQDKLAAIVMPTALTNLFKEEKSPKRIKAFLRIKIGA
jgi:hypothetical protein